MQAALMLVIVASGAGLAVETAANTRLGEVVKSPMLAALLSFLIGAAAIAVLTIFGLMGRGKLDEVGGAPWWAWTGGLLGAFSVVMSILGLQRKGAGSVVAATVFGQLVAGLALDSFGWLGVQRIPINGWRLLGGVLLFAGALLLQRR